MGWFWGGGNRRGGSPAREGIADAIAHIAQARADGVACVAEPLADGVDGGAADGAGIIESEFAVTCCVKGVDSGFVDFFADDFCAFDTDFGDLCGISFDPTVPLGIMVETPAAALALPHLMPCVDFLSVGTNDLLQFVMAVDRNHTQLHHLFQPLHPGFLRLLSWIANSASQAKCPLSICGEIAANPLFLPIWLGLGFREFSVTPHAIPPLQHRLQSLHLQEAQHTAQIALSLPSSEQIHTLLETPHNALNTPPPSHL